MVLGSIIDRTDDDCFWVDGYNDGDGLCGGWDGTATTMSR